MKVRVLSSVADYTDGRERFAGREGEVTRPPAGRYMAVEEDPWVQGEIREHAYTVRFDDGDEAVFLSNELESDEMEMPEFRQIEGPSFGGLDSVSTSEEAVVTEVAE